MKTALFVILMSVFAFAAPMTCEKAGSPYSVKVAGNYNSAEVILNGATAEFGSLVCAPSEAPTVAYECRSTNVADAGYTLTLKAGGTCANCSLWTAKLSEVTIAGTKVIAELECSHE